MVGSGQSKEELSAVLQIIEEKKGKHEQRVQGVCEGDQLESRQEQRSGQTTLVPGASPLDGKEPLKMCTWADTVHSSFTWHLRVG